MVIINPQCCQTSQQAPQHFTEIDAVDRLALIESHVCCFPKKEALFFVYFFMEVFGIIHYLE